MSLYHRSRDRAKSGFGGRALSPHHAIFAISREAARTGQVGRRQTHLCVIGHVGLVIRVGKAHSGWGFDIQHVGDLEGRGE